MIDTMFNNSRKPGLLRHRAAAVRPVSKQCTAQNRKVVYRVGYSWNKGGRLKELRIRHLARKFLRIWIQNTFGRVLPLRAKLHYNSVILKKVFGAWKDEWWTSRREWSLTLRADCHHRYFLLNQTFHRWKHFVVLEKEEKMKLQKALSFADRHRLHHAWERWMDFTGMRRLKKQNLDTALQFYKQATLKATWIKWMCKLQHIMYLYAIMTEAHKQQRLTLQHKVMLCWRDMYTVSCHNRLNELKASRHNTTRRKRKAFNQWVMYAACRRIKDKSKVVGENIYKLRLTRLHWRKWCQALYEKWSEVVRLEAAGHLATRICQHRVVHRWKAYVKLCHEKTESLQKIQEHYHHHLLRVAFGGFRHNVQLNISKRLNSNVAVQHYSQTILRKFWRLWLEHFEEAEDRSFQPLTEKAKITYSIYLSRVCFSIWRDKLAELRHTQILSAKADMLYADHLMLRCFQSWHDFTSMKTTQKQGKIKAEHHNRWRQFSWAFYTWRGMFEERKTQRLAMQMALFHEEQRRMQKVWIIWRKQTDVKIKEQVNEEVSVHQYQQRLLQKSITLWKRNVATIKERRTRELQACNQGDLHILRNAVRRWKKFVLMQKTKRKKAEEMQQYHEVQLLKLFFTTWKKSNMQMQAIYAHADLLHKQQTQTSQRRMLKMWQENAVISSDFKILKQMARNHHRHVLQVKMFGAWREATVHAVIKHHQLMAVCKTAKEAINQGQLLKYYRKWQGQTKQVQKEKLNLCKALCHCDTTILSKAIRAWKSHHKKYQKYKVMKRQACLLLRLKIWQNFFDLWKVKLQHKRIEAKQTEQALWHWSLSLQAKVLFAWRYYVVKQHREREERAQAAQFYRDKLLREGVSCILTYAAQMNDLTTSLTQQTKEQHPRRIQRVVRRCALKWKHKALCKTENNHSLVTVQLAKKSVSFCLPEIRGDSKEEEDQVLMKMLLSRMPRHQPQWSEDLLKTPPSLALSERSAAVSVTSTHLGINSGAQLHPLSSENSTQNQMVLLPPSAFMTTLSQSAKDLPNEQSSQSVPPATDPVAELTYELLKIKQDMKSYQQDKRQLRAWCKLRDVLQTWLQTSGQDDLVEKEAVCQEVEELKKNIAQLTSQLSKQKPVILQHVKKIHHVQDSLHAST